MFPNQFVNARLLVDTKQSAVIVPTASIQRSPQSTFVYVVKDDSAVESRNVTIGPGEGDDVSITKGLSPGEVVVVEGVDRLQQGTKVQARMAGVSQERRQDGSQEGARTPRSAGRQPGSARKTTRKAIGMSPSTPFILRPVATSLLMVAIMLAGAWPITNSRCRHCHKWTTRRSRS